MRKGVNITCTFYLYRNYNMYTKKHKKYIFRNKSKNKLKKGGRTYLIVDSAERNENGLRIMESEKVFRNPETLTPDFKYITDDDAEISKLTTCTDSYNSTKNDINYVKCFEHKNYPKKYDPFYFLEVEDLGAIKTIYAYVINNNNEKQYFDPITYEDLTGAKIITPGTGNETITCIDYPSEMDMRPTYNRSLKQNTYIDTVRHPVATLLSTAPGIEQNFLEDFYKKHPNLQYVPCDKILLAQAKKLLEFKKEDPSYHIPRSIPRGDDNIMGILILINTILNYEFKDFVGSTVSGFVGQFTKSESGKIIAYIINLIKTGYLSTISDFINKYLPYITSRLGIQGNTFTEIIRNQLHKNNLQIVDHSIRLITVIFPNLISKTEDRHGDRDGDGDRDDNNVLKNILKKYIPLILDDLVSTQKRPDGAYVDYTDCLSQENLFYIIDNAYYLSQVYESEITVKGGDSYLINKEGQYEICNHERGILNTICDKKEIKYHDLLQVHGLGGINSIPNELLSRNADKPGNKSIKIDETKDESKELTCIDYPKDSHQYNDYIRKYPSLNYPSCEEILLEQGTKYLDNQSTHYLKRDYGRGDDNIVNIMVVIQEYMPLIKRIVGVVKTYVDTKETIINTLDITSQFPTFKSLFGTHPGFKLPTFNPITRIIQMILKDLKLDIVEHSLELITELFPILLENVHHIDKVKESLKIEVPNILNDLLKTKLKPDGNPIVYTDIFRPDGNPDNDSLFFIIDHAYYLSRIYKLNKANEEKYKIELETQEQVAPAQVAPAQVAPISSDKKPFKLRRIISNITGIRDTGFGRWTGLTKKGGKHIRMKKHINSNKSIRRKKQQKNKKIF